MRRNLKNALDDLKLTEWMISADHQEATVEFLRDLSPLSENLIKPVINYMKLNYLSASVRKVGFHMYKLHCDSLLRDIISIYILLPENEELQMKIGEIVNRYTAMGAMHFIEGIQELNHQLFEYASNFSRNLAANHEIKLETVIPMVDTLLSQTESISQIHLSLPEISTQGTNVINAAIDQVLSSVGDYDVHIRECVRETIASIITPQNHDQVFASILGLDPQTDFRLFLELAYVFRTTMGINIFQNNICLLEFYEISEVTREIIKRGDIFVYAHIIQSQDIPRPQIDLIHQSSDDEAVSFDLALRQTVEGIRSFWRQNNYPAFRYPLASLCQTVSTDQRGRSSGLMPSDRTTIENLLKIHDYKSDMLFFLVWRV
jgi:hypothetical protein